MTPAGDAPALDAGGGALVAHALVLEDLVFDGAVAAGVVPARGAGGDLVVGDGLGAVFEDVVAAEAIGVVAVLAVAEVVAGEVAGGVAALGAGFDVVLACHVGSPWLAGVTLVCVKAYSI